MPKKSTLYYDELMKTAHPSVNRNLLIHRINRDWSEERATQEPAAVEPKTRSKHSPFRVFDSRFYSKRNKDKFTAMQAKINKEKTI